MNLTQLYLKALLEEVFTTDFILFKDANNFNRIVSDKELEVYGEMLNSNRARNTIEGKEALLMYQNAPLIKALS